MMTHEMLTLIKTTGSDLVFCARWLSSTRSVRRALIKTTGSDLVFCDQVADDLRLNRLAENLRKNIFPFVDSFRPHELRAVIIDLADLARGLWPNADELDNLADLLAAADAFRQAEAQEKAARAEGYRQPRLI